MTMQMTTVVVIILLIAMKMTLTVEMKSNKNQKSSGGADDTADDTVTNCFHVLGRQWGREAASAAMHAIAM